MAAKKPATQSKRQPAKTRSAGPTQRRLPPQERKAELLEVAKTVLLPNPDATLEDVAAAAGVTRQLVSLYFPGGGTGPLYAAMFDEYIAQLPGLLGEDLLEVGRNGAKLRTAVERIVAAMLDWAEEIGQSWVFADTRGRSGAVIAERWDQTIELTADALSAARGPTKNPELVRAALIAELHGFSAVTHRFLDGEISRAAAQKVLVEGFVALYTVVLPALSR